MSAFVVTATLTAAVTAALAVSAVGQDTPAAAPAAQQPAAQEPVRFEMWHPNTPKSEADYKVAKWGPRHLPSPGYAFFAQKVLPITSAPILDGVVVTRNGTIEAIGKRGEVTVPAGYERIECGDSILFPGIIELHCHIASPSFDLNDTVHPTNPEFRTLDLISMEHDQIKMARAGGVSTALYIPGSGSNMGGFGTLTKTYGKNPDEALVRFPGSLKIAQAGNPERGSGDLGTDMMGMAEGIRMTLLDGKRYWQEMLAFEQGTGPKPQYDPTLELISGLFRHEYPVSVHTQIYQVVLETLQELRQELGLWTVIVHGTFDGYRLSEDLLKAGVPVAGGPRAYHFDRGTGAMEGVLANYANGGLHGWRSPVLGLGRDGVGVNTDSPVIAEEQLTLQAAMGVRLGWPHEWALRGLTINAARFVGIDHRVGSLEVGKDADLGIWSGDPVDPRSHVELMVINGTICYRRNPDRPEW
ncbi:MAG: amidohydrolase family protein [Planctomycetes bacterium]|nr:amidohydrolase family protein [Planctomycetota bacterium]